MCGIWCLVRIGKPKAPLGTPQLAGDKQDVTASVGASETKLPHDPIAAVDAWLPPIDTRSNRVNVQKLSHLVQRRGPDCTRRLSMTFSSSGERISWAPHSSGCACPTCVIAPQHCQHPDLPEWVGDADVLCEGSVLALRGSSGGHCDSTPPEPGPSTVVPVEQPALVASTSVASAGESAAPQLSSWLMWNGEVFGGVLDLAPDESDTLHVLRQLHLIEGTVAKMDKPEWSCGGSAEERAAELLQRFVDCLEDRIHGPYAFIYYAHSFRTIVYGRDPLGRRSLLVHRVVYDAAAEPNTNSSRPETSAFVQVEELVVASVAGEGTLEPAMHCSACLAAPSATGGGVPAICGQWTEVPVTGLLAVHLSSEMLEVGGDEKGRSLPMTLRYLFTPWRGRHHRIHPLLRTPHPEAGERNARDATATAVGVLPRDTPCVGGIVADIVRRVGYIPHPVMDSPAHACERYLSALLQAVRYRVAHETTGRNPARPVSVLFSGGIDSTVIAALAHYCLPEETPIELINVAFGSVPQETPDRMAAISAMRELLELPTLHAPGRCDAVFMKREWRLVLVDVSTEELSSFGEHILSLVHPRDTIMDHNIGAAIWFAARGIGRMQRLSSSVDAASARACADQRKALSNEEIGTDTYEIVTSHASFHKHLRVAKSARVNSANETSEHPPQVDAPPLFRKKAKCETAAASEPKEPSVDHEMFQPLIDVLIGEGYESWPSESSLRTGALTEDVVPSKPRRAQVLPKGHVLLSTLGKEYGSVLTPVWSKYGYRKLGQYLSDAAAAGLIHFRSLGSTPRESDGVAEAHAKGSREREVVKYVVLRRAEDIARAAAVCYDNHFTYRDAGIEPPPAIHAGYQCESKVVLLGMGADETLGGYVRYARSFQRGGGAAVAAEMASDFERLWERNLGRDDRCVSDSGREGRFPFLDEGVLSTLELLANEEVTASTGVGAPLAPPGEQTPLLRASASSVCDFTAGPGIGDKKLLRTCARLLGLTNVSWLQKRAIQFGTRIANNKLRGGAALRSVDMDLWSGAQS